MARQEARNRSAAWMRAEIGDLAPARLRDAVIKAYGRPVVSRGVLAVQIERVFTSKGKRAA